jgi:hypothetical protein
MNLYSKVRINNYFKTFKKIPKRKQQKKEQKYI